MFIVLIVATSIVCFGIISNTTSAADGFTSSEILIIIIILFSFFAALTIYWLALEQRAKINITENGISQQNLLFKPIFIQWEEIKEYKSLLGIRIIKSSNKSIQIHLEDFKNPNNVILDIESKLPTSVLHK